MKSIIFISFFMSLVLAPYLLQGQEVEEINGFSKRIYTINRITESPRIDGSLDDAAWQNQVAGTDFTERYPTNGGSVPSGFKTEFRMVYDDVALYVSAYFFDPEPEKIQYELTERDAVGNDDFIFLVLNGFNDGQQAAEFIVTAAGVQWDAYYANGVEDVSWNGIWNSAVQIQDDGWSVEIRIPFRELRFPNKPVQEWGFNLERDVRRLQSRFSFNPVDNTKGSFYQYNAILRGIKDLKTPVRLSLFPYLSTYINQVEGTRTTDLRGGMDIRYGINDAFTLDATLIPDFGQAGFDEVLLNLGPFEQRFTEQRQFFIEGMDLFTKGDLFFSRRIGEAPSDNLPLSENEKIIEAPNAVKTLNAVKVSGRTNQGLGLGFFNVITDRTFAIVEDLESLERRKGLIAPLANYNISVADQRLKNNASISLVNTNVFRGGGFRDANVTGLYFAANNKTNSYRFSGNIENSWVWADQKAKTGQEVQLRAENIDGAHRFGIFSQFRTPNYDIDDLGFTGRTNFIDTRLRYSYRLLQPIGKLNNFDLEFILAQRQQLQPQLLAYHYLVFNTQFTSKQFHRFGGSLSTNLGHEQDLFESRTLGQHFTLPGLHLVSGYFQSDQRKPYAIRMSSEWTKYWEPGRYDASVAIENQIRISNQFNTNISVEYFKNNRQEGYAAKTEQSIVFGRRNRNTWITKLGSQFTINKDMLINFTFRHYYTEVVYTDYFSLERDGELSDLDYAGQESRTFNTWNIDMRFSWWYAPGSQLSVLYRNAMLDSISETGLSARQNFDHLFASQITHNISLRVVYFLDYNELRTHSKKNKSIKHF